MKEPNTVNGTLKRWWTVVETAFSKAQHPLAETKPLHARHCYQCLICRCLQIRLTAARRCRVQCGLYWI